MMTWIGSHPWGSGIYAAVGLYLLGYVLASNKGRLRWWDAFLLASIVLGWPAWFLIGLGVKLSED